MQGRLFTVYQIADLLGDTPVQVVEWMQKGWITFERLQDGGIRISEKALMQFLKDRGIDIEEIMDKMTSDDDVAQGESSSAQAEEIHVELLPELPVVSADEAAVETDGQAEKSEPVEAPALPVEMNIPAMESPYDQVETVLRRAVACRAGFLHIEPAGENVSVRMRIDGVLHGPIPQPDGKLIADIKSLAGVDDAASPPRAGGFNLSIDGRQVRFDLSSCPTSRGEKLAIRVVDPDLAQPGIAELGLAQEYESSIRQMLSRPYGLVLVAAPPRNGCGTTLRAMLAELDRQGRNIVAVERRADSHLDGVNQSIIDAAAGFTFARAMQTFADQDADVTMITEVRDPASANAAIEAAVTGRLVLAGVRADSAVEALAMFVRACPERYALASSLLGAIAQRTLRKVCNKCKRQVTPPPQLLATMHLQPEDVGSALWAGEGCDACSQCGHAGLTGVFEMLPLCEGVLDAVRRGDVSAVSQAAQDAGMTPLAQAALEKVRAGATSLEEVARRICV